MVNRMLLFLLISPISWAWQQDFDSYYEEIGVVLYQLQVNVRDKNGDPVRGLTKDDFQVKLDGKLQEIQSIEEISLDTMVSDNQWQSLEDIPQQARRVFVFFFDLRYSTRRGLQEARDAAAEFVQSEILTSDLVAVFAYQPLGGIDMVTNFTSDPTHLLKALDHLSFANGRHIIQDPAGYYLDGLLDEYMTQLNGDPNSTIINTANNTISNSHLQEMVELAARSENRNYDREVLHFLGNLEAFANGLKYVHGRKNLIWFSTGFDSSSLIGADFEDLSQNAERSISGQYERVRSDQLGEGDIQHKVRTVVEQLQGSGTVIFSVDTSLGSGTSSEKVGLQTLNMFSVDTGGRTFTNSNKLLPALEKIKDITNDYYLVSFYPEAKLGRGEVGRLKVNVDVPRTTVYANKGLILQPDFRKMSELEKQIHLAEFVSRDQIARAIPIDMKITPLPMSNMLVKLSIQAEIRGDYFLVTQNNRKPRNIEIFTYAFVEETNQVFDSSHFQFKIETNKIRTVLEKTGVKYFANLFTKPGAYKLKMIVRDMDTGKVGTAIQNLVVHQPQEGLIAAELVTQQPWVLLRDTIVNERKKRLGNLDFTYPYQLASTEPVPQIHQRLMPGQKAKFLYVLNLKPETAGIFKPQIASAITDQNGKAIPLPANAFEAEYDFKGSASPLATILLTVDFDQIPLVNGNSYQMLTQFTMEGHTPIRATAPFTVDSL